MGYFVPNESVLIALKLKLDAIGITVDDYYNSDREGKRKIHCTFYLARELGARTGYRFGWYTYGIYSPELREDLWHLSESVIDISEYELNKTFNWPLKKARQLKDNPVRLANYHFLRKYSKVDHDKAVEILNNVGKGYDDSIIEYLKVYKLWDKEWDSHKSHKESV